MCPSLIQIESKTAEKNSAQTNKQTDRHYENNGHLAVNQQVSSCWRTRATRCITANVLQTKVDAQCDKLATELVLCQKLPILTYPTCIWRLRRGWCRLSFAEIFSIRKLESLGYRVCSVVCVILRLAVSV